jgi:hypothetical protein
MGLIFSVTVIDDGRKYQIQFSFGFARLQFVRLMIFPFCGIVNEILIKLFIKRKSFSLFAHSPSSNDVNEKEK